MTLTPELREQARLSLLRLLEANTTRYGLSEGLLCQMLRSEGFGDARYLTAAELLYLQDKGFVVPADKRLSPENRAWRITAEGRDFLAER